MSLTTDEKTVVIDSIKAVKADVTATIASTAAGSLGKQIDDLDPATSTEAQILAAYDAERAYRLLVPDTMLTVLIAKARAT